MTGKAFAETLLEESDFQFMACLKGLSESDFEKKPVEHLMSMKECLEHMTECCLAVQTISRGEKHDWGNYKFPKGTMSELIALYQSERAKSSAIALERFEEESHFAKDFFIAHEFYHVGQMAAVRMALEPDWNMYSIYRF
ncbi:MAG: hypothetical protein JST51_16480 [Armatimonadetes bacterium]|nr:hypothetical protein [Armatimonadota bacterium]